MMQYVLRTKMGYSVEQSDAMIKQLDNVEEMQKNRQAATQQTALKMTTDAYVDRYGIGNQFVRDYRQTVDSTLGAMGRGLGRLNDDITTGVTGWYNRNVLGMGPQANLNFNTLTERNALLDSLPALQLTPAQQMQERGAAFQRAAGVSEDVSPFKATALGVGVGLAVAGIGVATGGLGFVAGAAALAGGATLGGGTGFLASLGSAFNQRSTTVADLAFKHGELKDSDLAKKEDPDAIRVGDGKYVKKGALDRVSEKYKGTLRVSAEDISKDITKDMSSGQLNTFMATRSHSLDDVGMARVVMADMDVSLLSPEKQQAYRSKQAELNKYGPASAEAVSKMNTEFVDKLAITDFSEKGQQIYVGIRGMRGEHKLAAEKLNIASGAAGVDVKQLGSVQEKLRDATDQLKGSYRGAIVKAGAFSETGDTREGLGDAQELATTILDSPNGLTLMHDLNSGDENKRTNARATLQQRLSNTEYYRNKGPAEITKAVDKISENVSRSDNIKQRLADYQTYALSEKNIKSQILYDSAVKNLDSVKSKANLTADQAQQLETAFVKNINGDVSDVEAINNAKALVSTLETTGAGNYLPTMKRAAQLATTLENVETADIKGISQILGREVTREELRAKGVAETRKALALKGQQDAGAVAIATEEGTTAGLSGMPQMAAALKVVEEQTRAVAQAVQILTGINTNMNAQPALGGKRGWGQ
jgi:hypothetical protein